MQRRNAHATVARGDAHRAPPSPTYSSDATSSLDVVQPVSKKAADLMASQSPFGRSAPYRVRDVLVAVPFLLLLMMSAMTVADDLGGVGGEPRSASYGSFSSVTPPAMMQLRSAQGDRKMNKVATARRNAASFHDESEAEGASSPFAERSSVNDASSSDGSATWTMGDLVLDALRSQQSQSTSAATDRMLIKEGELTGRVPGSALESATRRIASLDDPSFGEGGYVASRSTSESEYHVYPRRSGGTRSYKRMTQRVVDLSLRIPTSHFDLAIDRIKQIVETAVPDADESSDHKGRVVSSSTRGRDVTDEYVDSTARADTLDASRNAVRALLSRADEVDDVMKIQAELNELTQRSESLRRRAIELKNLATLSTIAVRLEEWREDDDAGDDGDDDEKHGKWSPFRAVMLAWTHISFATMFAFDTLAYSVVWAVPLIALYYAGICVATKLFIR